MVEKRKPGYWVVKCGGRGETTFTLTL